MSNPKAPADAIDARLVRKLAAILNDTGLTEIEVEQGDLRIKVARTVTVAAGPQMTPTYVTAGPAPAAPAPAPASTPAAPPVRAGEEVKSPIVGTVYLQSAPNTPPFVKVGDTVTEGQTLLIIEAMKTMNPIPAPRAGKILELLVGDGQPVEYGEPLVMIE